MIIRPLNTEDYDAADAMFSELHALHVKSRPDIYKPISHLYSRQQFSELIADQGILSYGVEDGGKLVGLSTVYLKASANHHVIVAKPVAYMENFCISHDYQRQGAGRLLFEYVEKEAKSRGAERLDLMVWSFNSDALDFYKAMGMTPQRNVMEKEL